MGSRSQLAGQLLRALTGLAAALLLLAVGVSPGRAATGEALYRAACATCHGADGRGAPAGVVTFEELLPDFTDCRFAVREPDADWLAVTHDGGPARGFAHMMPAFGATLDAAEIALVVAHMRKFCRDRAWPRGELNLPRALVTEKAFPEDEAVLTATVAAQGRGSVAGKLIYEQRLGPRNQVELVVPFGWAERQAVDAATPGRGWTGGLGDIALGFKRVLFHSLERGTIVSVAGEARLPTGERREGFGGRATALEPFLAVGQLLPADTFLQLQTGVELPLSSAHGEPEGFWRLALGRSFTRGRFGRSFSPMVEVLGSRELAKGAESHWYLVPQVQVTLNQRQHLMANLGVRLPADDRSRDTQILFYFLWDWFDGGLLDGW
jgi:hypothetical protein